MTAAEEAAVIAAEKADLEAHIKFFDPTEKKKEKSNISFEELKKIAHRARKVFDEVDGRI